MLLLLAFAAGLIAHQALRPAMFQIDAYASRFIGAYIIGAATVFLDSLVFRGLDAAAALTNTILVATGFNVGLFGSILVYRAFFHRLRRFPGPFAAKLSRFYVFAEAFRTKKLHLKLEKLRKRYGDFVRVGPREIAIYRPSAISVIYGPTSKCIKSEQYDNPSNDASKNSLVATRNFDIHRRRKKAWERGLSFRALSVYEPRIISKVELLLSRIDLHVGVPVDAAELAMFFAFDAMGDIGFSKDFQMLESGHDHPAIKALHAQLVYAGVLLTVPWLFILLSEIMNVFGVFGLKTSFVAFLDWCSQELDAKRIAINSENKVTESRDPQDVLSWLIKSEEESDGSAPLGESAFQEDSRVLVVAGSDTTSVALTNALYYLTANPKTYQALQHALAETFPGNSGSGGITSSSSSSPAYLDAVIYETLRLKPSVPFALSRLTPPNGIHVDGVFIPGDTNVCVPTHAIHRDERYWGPDACEFVPERWLQDRGEGASGRLLATDDKMMPFIPFQRGQYACPGRHLAMMELRLALSRIALRYNLEFSSAEEAKRFDEGALDTFTMTVPPLPLVFTQR